MTWLGPWKVKDATLRVWLEADDETRAKRISGRDKMTYEEALDHVRKRDPGNVRRYKEYYGIDILDHSNFDLVVNTSHFNPIDAAKIIALAAKMPKLPKNE